MSFCKKFLISIKINIVEYCYVRYGNDDKSAGSGAQLSLAQPPTEVISTTHNDINKVDGIDSNESLNNKDNDINVNNVNNIDNVNNIKDNQNDNDEEEDDDDDDDSESVSCVLII